MIRQKRIIAYTLIITILFSAVTICFGAEDKLTVNSLPNVLTESYIASDLQQAIDSAEDCVIACEGCDSVLNRNMIEKMETSENKVKLLCEKKDDILFIPINFFSEFFNAVISKEKDVYTISLNDKTAMIYNGDETEAYNKEIIVNPEERQTETILYVPLIKTAKKLSMYTADGEKIAAVGFNDSIKLFNSLETQNDYCDIIEYLLVSNSRHYDAQQATKIARNNWKKQLVGDEISCSNNIGKSAVERIDKSCSYALNKLTGVDGKLVDNYEINIGLSNSFLNSSLLELFVDKSPVSSDYMTKTYQRVSWMAIAYGTYGGKFYRDENLKQIIYYCVDWLYDNRYGESEKPSADASTTDGGWACNPANSNWWDWDIGTPQYLINILMIMYDDLHEDFSEDADDKIFRYLSLFDELEPKAESTGANRTEIVNSIIGSCVLKNSTDETNIMRLLQAKDDILCVFNYCDDGKNAIVGLGSEASEKIGQGFYSDGSYIFHYRHPMNGAYGIDQLENIAFIVRVLHGTGIDFDTSVVNNMPDWIYNSFRPLMNDGAVMRMVRGRNDPVGEHTAGIRVLSAMLDMTDFVDGNNLERIKSIIKTQALSDKTVYDNSKKNEKDRYVKSEYITTEKVVKLSEIINDAAISENDDYLINKIYFNMDKAVHHRDNFTAGISMSSKRIYGYECSKNQNMTGWYLGQGMTCIYTKNDDVQYSDEYWKNVDPYRLPGITADTKEREQNSVNTRCEWHNDEIFVGGVSWADTFGTATMNLKSYDEDADQSNLTGKKAWFMFDNEIVALGCDITETKCTENQRVISVVDNCMYDKSDYTTDSVYTGNSTINETVPSNTINDAELSITGKTWVNWNNKRGYYFPYNNSNAFLRNKNTDNGNRFFELWFDHGCNPSVSNDETGNDKYAYVMLPGENAYDTMEYSKNPDIEIKSNTGNLQSVYDKKLDLTSGVFRNTGTMEYIIDGNSYNFTTNCPMIAMIGKKDDYVMLTVSDPTHLLNEKNDAGNNIAISLGDEYELIYADKELSPSVVNTSEYNIDFSNSDGKTVTACFIRKNAGNICKTVFENGLGTRINKLPKNGREVKAVSTVVNSSSEKSDTVMIYACYDENGNLISVSKTESEMIENSLQRANCSIDVSKQLGSIKAFCWYDNNNIVPFCKTDELR